MCHVNIYNFINRGIKMLKNTHIKTIITFLIIGIVIITSLGMYQIINLRQIVDSQMQGIMVQEKINQVIKITVILDFVYAVICLIIAIVITRLVNKPITKLLKDADKVISVNKKEKKNKNADEIVDTFNMMTDELKENLNEM